MKRRAPRMRIIEFLRGRSGRDHLEKLASVGINIMDGDLKLQGDKGFPQTRFRRSRLRYCIASDRWAVPMFSKERGLKNGVRE